MVARAAPTTATKARFETELGRVHGCVRREFLRAGIRSEPWGEWPLEEKWGRDLQKVATSPECHRLTTVFFAAEVVQKTYDSLYGPREAVIGALEELTAAVQRANAVAREDGVKAYLTSVANIGWQFAFQEEERVDSRELPALRDSLHWELLRDFAEAADAVAKHLRLRRPPALDANAYATKGAGPIAHFCYELFRPDPASRGRLEVPEM